MRDLINLLETLYDIDGDEAIGYWFNPKTKQYYIIAWDAAEGDPGTYTDHADVVWDHPDWFGLDSDYLGDDADSDTARYGAIFQGWVRIGYNSSMGMWMDAINASFAHRALRWFMARHPEAIISKITIDIVTHEGYRSHTIPESEVAEYESNGRLPPPHSSRTW